MAAQRFSAAARVKAAPEVLATAFGDETVILDLKAGTYFGLDDVGTTIWQCIERGESVQGICDAILAEYQVDAATVDADLQELLQELVRRQLAEVVEERGDARTS